MSLSAESSHGLSVAKKGELILIVDDEVSIRRSLDGVLRDEGFRTLEAEDGESALTLLETVQPALIFLDIWMRGIDGLETLVRIKRRFPHIPVIMISGHATIATAIRATRLGASDFIEKPLDLHATLRAVQRVLKLSDEESAPGEALIGQSDELLSADDGSALPELARVVFASQALRGDRVLQKTLKHSALVYGQGLHSGKKSGLILEPLPSGSGIHFVGVSETAAVPAHIDYVQSTGFATTVRLGQTKAGTIEHLMSALHAYGITNLLVKCNGEVPVLDGSSRDFCSLIEEVGLEVQAGDWFEIAIDKVYRIDNGRESIQLEPAAKGFTVEYILDYPQPLGSQTRTFTLSPDEYRREIAPARTFGFVKDIGALQKQGLALGGRFDNFVLFGDDGAINTELRFNDEPVRHKILDAIGDLYLLGRPLRGKVTARMTGHSDNISILAQVGKVMKDAAAT